MKNPLQAIIEQLIIEAAKQRTAADDATHAALQQFEDDCVRAWEQFNMRTKGDF